MSHVNRRVIESETSLRAHHMTPWDIFCTPEQLDSETICPLHPVTVLQLYLLTASPGAKTSNWLRRFLITAFIGRDDEHAAVLDFAG